MESGNILKLFMEPKSVAVIGASRRGSKEGFLNPLECMADFDYPGKVYAINPNATEIFGVKSYSKLEDLPDEVDLAMIMLPRDGVLQAVKDCLEKGIKAILIHAQGFADADEKGKALQSEITKIARERGARILGPNTVGVINAFSKFHCTFFPLRSEKTLPLAVRGPSGAGSPFRSTDGKRTIGERR